MSNLRIITAQAVRHCFPTVAARVRVRGCSSVICGGQIGSAAGFLWVLQFLLPIFIPPNSPSSQSPGAGTIGQKWPACRVDSVCTPFPPIELKKKWKLHILFYNDSLVIWTVVSLNTTKFKPLIFYMSGFTLSYTANMLILMILYDFCLSPAQIRYIIIYTQNVESCVQTADRCGPWKISSGAQNLVFHALKI
jgi:hypothetical protein